MVMSKKYIKRANSQDVVRGYNLSKGSQTVFPNYDLNTTLAMVESDPTARGAINHYIDRCMEGGYSWVDRKTSRVDNNFYRNMEEQFGFRHRVLRKTFVIGKIYRNVFWEIVRGVNDNTKDINVLDTRNIEPITKPNGDPIEYQSKIENPITGKKPTWSKEDIVWVKFNDRAQGWAPIDLRALHENLLVKQYIRQYTAWLWKTGQYRTIFTFPKGSSNDDIENFLVYNRQVENDPQKPFIAKGEVEQKVMRDMQESESIVSLYKYYDNQTLQLLRIPPIEAGVPDASGRANAENQSSSINAHITSDKKAIEDKVNYELLRKINRATKYLRFRPNDYQNFKQAMESAQMMKAMGMSSNAVEEQLNYYGVYFAQKPFAPTPEEQLANSMKNPKEKDQFPSRMRKGEGEANETQDEPTTREDQLQ